MITRSNRLVWDKSDGKVLCKANKHKQNVTQPVCMGGCVHVGISYNMIDMLEQGL